MGTRFFIFCLIIFLAGCQVNNKYYFDSVNGNDNNSGTINLPFKSIKKLNQIDLKNESEIYLANGSVFNGSIELKNKKNIIISSYKNNSSEKKPIINAKGNLSGILVENSSNINISNIQIEANGGNESHNPHQLLKQDLRAGILYIVSDASLTSGLRPNFKSNFS